MTAPPAEQVVRVTTGESKGDPGVLNPEQLLLMAASSCQMLWFLHLAAKARVDVVAYEDQAEALMPEDEEPVRITESPCTPVSPSRATRARSACGPRRPGARLLLHREHAQLRDAHRADGRRR